MKSILILLPVFSGMFFTACKNQRRLENPTAILIGHGQIPDAVSDANGNLHLVFGNGDSIMYSTSKDAGITFSKPDLVSILPGLASSAMRGPQIALSSNHITIIACNNKGDIFSYQQNNSGDWQPAARLNDVDTVAKENLMDLNGNGQTLYAVWLDLRDKHNKIFGARSTDGGHSWSKNIMVYTSPDSTVCECCKPSVVVKDNKVYVMFRNWLKGNRDLYLIQSGNGGLSFTGAQQLGNGHWALNGCPMDGGGLAIGDNTIQTVWNRKGKIYACEAGRPETEIGEGRGCTMERVNGKNIYAWTEKGEVVCKLPTRKIVLGKGSSPVINAIGNGQVVCTWENEKLIHSRTLNL